MPGPDGPTRPCIDADGYEHLRRYYEAQQQRIPADVRAWLDAGELTAGA